LGEPNIKIINANLAYCINQYTVTPDDGLDLSRNMLWYTCLIKHAETLLRRRIVVLISLSMNNFMHIPSTANNCQVSLAHPETRSLPFSFFTLRWRHIVMPSRCWYVPGCHTTNLQINSWRLKWGVHCQHTRRQHVWNTKPWTATWAGEGLRRVLQRKTAHKLLTLYTITPYILESNPHLVFAALYCSYDTYTGSIIWPNSCCRLRIESALDSNPHLPS
jgi:hypothetical protein